SLAKSNVVGNPGTESVCLSCVLTNLMLFSVMARTPADSEFLGVPVHPTISVGNPIANGEEKIGGIIREAAKTIVGVCGLGRHCDTAADAVTRITTTRKR